MVATYMIREIFDTLQGEGARAGRRSVFIRFAGCNMWNGEPEDRDKGKGTCADWCDTDFRSSLSTKMTSAEILKRVNQLWDPITSDDRWVVLSGGEPGLQLDRHLLFELRDRGIKVAVETNGSNRNVAVSLCDWVTVSPKLPKDPGADLGLRIEGAHELKVVIAEGDQWTDDALLALEKAGRWKNMYVQPRDEVLGDLVEISVLRGNMRDPDDPLVGVEPTARHAKNLARCIRWVRDHPRWGLSLQTHKYTGLA